MVYLDFSDFPTATIPSILVFPLPVNSSNHPCPRENPSHSDLFTLSSCLHANPEKQYRKNQPVHFKQTDTKKWE